MKRDSTGKSLAGETEGGSEIIMSQKIEYYQSLLDRCITLITACDNKASFALAIDGVFIATALQGITDACCMLKENQMQSLNLHYMALAAFGLAAVLLLYVILPRGNTWHKKSFLTECLSSIKADTSYLNDLEEQIKKNAQIYSQKCLICKIGLILLMVGIVTFLYVQFGIYQ